MEKMAGSAVLAPFSLVGCPICSCLLYTSRHICGMDDANSTEFDQKATHPVISLQEEQKGIKAVSYTHLDVYKRQLRALHQAGLITTEDCIFRAEDKTIMKSFLGKMCIRDRC